MTWLLVVFLPGHQRGSITLGPAEAGESCCAPVPEPVSCCAVESTDPADSPHPTSHEEPTARDVANCAVCYWAAGLLTTPPFVFDFSHAKRAFEHARAYHAQVQAVACRLNQYGRDPPARLPDSIVDHTLL